MHYRINLFNGPSRRCKKSTEDLKFVGLFYIFRNELAFKTSLKPREPCLQSAPMGFLSVSLLWLTERWEGEIFNGVWCNHCTSFDRMTSTDIIRTHDSGEMKQTIYFQKCFFLFCLHLILLNVWFFNHYWDHRWHEQFNKWIYWVNSHEHQSVLQFLHYHASFLPISNLQCQK